MRELANDGPRSRRRPTAHGVVPLVLAAGALLALGCEPQPIVSPDTPGPGPGPGGDGGADVIADVDGGTDEEPDRELQPCDPAENNEDCPEGTFCESTAEVCVECLTEDTRCNADGEREHCEAPQASGVGEVEGGFYEPDPCHPLESCVEQAGEARCEDRECAPGTRRCAAPAEAQRCNDSGTRWISEDCQPGWGCYPTSGECQRLRHRVLVVFDTSGSMHGYIDQPGTPVSCQENGTPCLEDYPTCDDPEDPLTMFTLAKTTFAEIFQEALGGFAQFALQRFPQREDASREPTCFSGYYRPQTLLTGDDGEHATGSEGWFEAHREQAVVVPFPRGSGGSNEQKLMEWLDFEEGLVPTDESCESHQDCPAGGRCGQLDGESVCYRHGEHELRARGKTPLGKSLFYAGEYFRRHVLIDGKPCEGSSDCPSAGYVCDPDDGVCRDPYRHCRDNFVVVFTDGEESEHENPEEDFFNPVVQAKRLAYGLGCAEDSGCRGEATCEDGICVPPQQTVEELPTSYVEGEGHDALRRPDDSPIRVRTSVVNLHNSPSKADEDASPCEDVSGGSGGGDGLDANDRIACAGGGDVFDVHAQEPAEIKSKLLQLMTPEYKCTPEELDDP